MVYSSPLPPFPIYRRLAVVGALMALPGFADSQAVPRTDVPRAGQLRVTFEPVITTWEREFTPAGRQPIAQGLPGPLFVRAERRVTQLAAEFGITNRISIGVNVPLIRTRVQESFHSDSTGQLDSASATLDSLLADPTFAYTPIRNTPRNLRFFPGDAELRGKYLLFASPTFRTSVALVYRLPTGHLDSPHDLFDLSSGDHQADLEAQAAQELIVADRLWLNVAVRAARQRSSTRERRVGPESQALLPRAATVVLGWRPGDYAAIDLAPLYRFHPTFAAGVTLGYFSKARDHYAYRSAADSVAVSNAYGSPMSASILNGGTSLRWLRLGAAVTYLGRDVEGSLSFEQTVSAAGGRVPAASVFRLVMRTTRWPF
jgi:hypothetical protein